MAGTSPLAKSNRTARRRAPGLPGAVVRSLPLRRIAACCAAPLAVIAVGCGGGERQDANEPSGTFTVAVIEARFPAAQALAEQAKMSIAVKNTGVRPLPDVAVTLGDEQGGSAFTRRSGQPDLADPSRPIWVVDAGPRGGDSAYVNTWALGALAPGATKRFTWHVTALVPGAHTVRYRVAAGLDGKAQAVLADGRAPEGSFDVAVSAKPSQARVDPSTGKVLRAK